MLTTATAYIPYTTFNIWDWLVAVWSITLAAVGAIYIYRQNCGTNGCHFLQRYFAIGWVVSVRWVLALLGAMVVYFTVITFGRVEIPVQTTWYDFLFFAIIRDNYLP